MVLTTDMATGAVTQENVSGFDSSDDEGDVDLSTFEVTWLPVFPDDVDVDNKLGVSALPGCRFKDTWRSLENDIRCLRAEGVDEVFCLCTKGELNKYRVPWLLNELTGADITVHHYPFPDGQVPPMNNLLKMVDEINVALQNGKKPLIHCYGGLGRSCLVAVCAMLVTDDSLQWDVAIDKIRTIRGPGAIQTVKQFNFVSEFRQMYAEYKKDNDTDQRSVSR